MDIKTSVSTFWTTNSALLIKIGVGIVLIVALVLIGQWWAGKKVNRIAADLRSQAILDNRPLYDNLAILKDKTNQLETQYSAQKSEIVGLKNKARTTTTAVFNSKDTKQIAAYFDNSIDSYVSEK